MGDAPDKSSEVMRNLSAVEAAEERAYQRGQATAKLKAQVESHERRLSAVNGSIERNANEMHNLAGTVSKLGEDFRQSVAITADRAQAAREAAERQVSTRTFILGLIGAVVAIGGLLAATGHA
jgi:chromosome segregation ATPase